MKHFIVTFCLIALVISQSCNNNEKRVNDYNFNSHTEKKYSSEHDIDVGLNEVSVLDGNGFIVSLNKNGEVVSRRGDRTTIYIDGFIKKGQEIFWENQNLGRFIVRLNDGSTHIFAEGNPNEIVEEKKLEVPHADTREEHKEKQNQLMKDPTLTADYNVLDTFQRADNVVVLTKDHRLWYYNRSTGHRAVFYYTNNIEYVEWKSFEEGKLLCHLLDGTEDVVQIGKPFPITGTKYHPYRKDPQFPSTVVIDANAVKLRTCPSFDDDCLLRDYDGNIVKLNKYTTLTYIDEVKGESRKDSFYMVEYDGDICYVNQYYAYAE